MNTLTSSSRVAAALVLAACLAGPSLSSVFAANPDPLSGARSRPITALYPNGLRARDVMRMSVHSSTGEEVGKIKDLVVDTRSGQIVYAVVSSGGVLGVGDTTRAVPMGAIHFENDRRESFALDVSTNDFQKAPAFSSEQLAALADENRADYIYRAYHQSWQPLTAGNSGDVSTFPLRLASSLMDADLRSGDQTVGHSQDLVVNMNDRKSALIVQPNESFAGTANPFVVPFNYVSVGNVGSDTFTTRVTRNDFTSAQAFDTNAWNSSSGIYRWQVGSQ